MSRQQKPVLLIGVVLTLLAPLVTQNLVAGRPNALTNVDEPLTGLWNVGSGMIVVDVVQGPEGGLTAECRSERSSVCWLKAKGSRSAQGIGGVIRLVVTFNGGTSPKHAVGELSGDGNSIIWASDDKPWTRISPLLGHDPSVLSNVGEYHRLVKAKHGIFMLSVMDHFVSDSIRAFGTWCEDELKFYASILQPGDIFVDAGANIGAFSIPLAKHIGASGRVHAFEAQPGVHRLLNTNVHLNELFGRVIANNVALGRRSGSIRVPRVNYEASGNFGGVSLVDRIWSEDESVSVPMTSLDEYMPDACPKLIKIDVEGMEVAVLTGAKQLLERCNQTHIFAENNCVMDSPPLLQILLGLDYRVFWHISPYFKEGRGRASDIYDQGMLSINVAAFPPAATVDPSFEARHVEVDAARPLLADYEADLRNLGIAAAQSGGKFHCRR